MLPCANAFRNGDIELAFLQHDAALCVACRHTQGNAAFRTAVRILQIDQHLGVMILPARMTPGALRRAGLTAEQRFEKVACVAVKLRTITTELESGIPIRRRLELLARLPALADLIICGTLLRVFQHRIGLADFLEPHFRIRILVYVRMIFARQFAVGALDLVLSRGTRNAEDFVVVLEFHVRNHSLILLISLPDRVRVDSQGLGPSIATLAQSCANPMNHKPAQGECRLLNSGIRQCGEECGRLSYPANDHLLESHYPGRHELAIAPHRTRHIHPPLHCAPPS